MFILGEVVVQLDYAVVAVTCTRHSGEEIAGNCREIADCGWPKISKQCVREPALLARGNQSPRFRHPGIRGFSGQAGQSEDVPLLFKAHKEEGLVLDDGTAHGEAGVVVAEGGCLWNIGTGHEERRACGIEFIPVVIVTAAVK